MPKLGITPANSACSFGGRPSSTDPRTAIPSHLSRRRAIHAGRHRRDGPEARLRRTELSGLWPASGKAVLLTGCDSGIGRAVAIPLAREGANLVISYPDEHDGAKETASWVEKAGKRAVLVPGDVSSEVHCQELVTRTVREFDRIDVLLNNAAFQASHQSNKEIRAEEWDPTFRTSLYAYFYLAKPRSGKWPREAASLRRPPSMPRHHRRSFWPMRRSRTPLRTSPRGLRNRWSSTAFA